MSEAELRRQNRFTWVLIAFSAVAIFLMAQQSRAALLNWDGDNAAGNFSYNNNWYGDNQPGWGFGNQLQFNYRNNAAQTSLYWDYGTGNTWNSVDNITFMSTWSGAVTWNGNGGGINFNDKIENQSSSTITFGTMNFSGGKNGASAIQLNPVNGDMTFNGNLYNDNSKGYQVWGANSKLLTIGTTLGVGTTAANVGFNIEQYSKAYFLAAQSYQSNTAIKVGELWLGTGGSIHANSKIDLGLNDSATAKFYLTGTATDSHNINVLNNGGIKVIGTLGTGGATNTFSGNITNNATSGGVLLENTADGVANFTGVISGTSSVQVGGSSTTATVILAGNNTFNGPLYVSAGTLSITNANSLGRGGIQFGNAGTSLSLLINSNNTITNQFRINNAATNGAINVASGITATISGQLTQDSTKTNSTKFGKDGAGTLILNNTNSDYNGQIQIGNGTVILGGNNVLGTNASTGARGVDLGLNVGDVSMTNNVSLLASNGVTVGQSIYIATSTNSATRTIGLSGNGTNTYNNQFYLDGNLTVNVGTAATDRVNLTGNITNTGSLIKTGSGFLSLSASNSYTGGTTIALGSTEGILIGHDNAFGTGGVTNLANGGTFQSDTTRTVANNFRLDQNTLFTGSGSLTINGTLSISASPDLTNNLTGGLTLNNVTLGSSSTSRTLSLRGTGTNTINGVIAGFAGQTNNGLVIGTGGGTNSTTILNGNNTYIGNTTINSGAIVRLGNANGLGATNSGTSISSLGGALDLNGQTGVAESITGGGTGVSSSGMLFNSSASVASLTGAVALTANTTVGVTNGAITLSGVISDSGGTRSFTKTGTGTLTLSGANSFSGGLTLDGGTLVVGDNSALGTGTAALGTSGNANVTLNSDSSARTLTNTFTFRNLTVGGTGALTLSGTSTLDAGSYSLTNNNSGGLTLGAINLSSSSTSRTLTILGTGNTTISGIVANGSTATGSSIAINSSGITTLSGANTFAGGVTLTAGTLVVGNNAALGTGAADFSSNVTLNSDSSARTITNAITFRNLTIGGTGALNLSGTLTHTAANNTLTNNNSGGLTIGGLNLSGTASGRTMTLTGSGNTTITGTIANGPSATTGGLTINSTGLTTLSGSNSYSGDTTITSGTVVLSGTNSGSGSVILSATSSVFKIGRTDSLVNGNLAGASSSGNTGLVDLTAGGNYSIASLGNSSANTRNLNFTNSSGLATTLTFTSSTNIISSGSNGSSTLTNASANLNIVFNGVVDMSGTGSNTGLTLDGPGNFTFNGGLVGTNTSGTRNFIKNGAGTVTFGAASVNNGSATVNAGTLATSANEVLQDSGTVSIASGATFRLGGNETVAQANSTSTGATINLQGYTLTVGGTGLTYTNSALTTGAGGKVVKNGAGQLYLDNSANTYSGGFTLNAGEVQFTSSGTAGSGVLSNSVFGTGTLTLAGGTIASSSTGGSSGRTIYNSVVLNGTVQMGQTGWGTTNATMNGGTALLAFSTNASGTTTLQGDSTINTLGYVQWDQAISGNYRLTKTGTGANNLSNNYLRLTTSNNIAGVTVNSGILGYKNRNALGTGTLILGDGVAVGQDGLINNANLTGNDQTDRSLGNNIQLNGNVTFGLGGTANHLGGTMDLNGATRTITLGNTTYQYGAVTNGGLVIDNGTAASSRMFGLYASNSYSGGTEVRTNAILAVGNDNALGTGALTFTNSTGSGNATLRASTVSTNASQTRTITNAIVLANGMNVTVDAVSSAQDSTGASAAVSINTTLAGNISGSGSLTKTNSNTLTLSGSNSYTGGTTILNGTLSGTTDSLQGAITNNGALKFDQASSGTYSGVISGSGNFEKRGVGEVTLSSANSYTGGTTISGGTLSGTTDSLQGAITNNSALKFDQASNGTYSGVISGSGTFEKKGVGEVTLNNANTYSGGTTITAGTLKLNRAGNGTGGTIVGTIAVTGGTLLLGQANQISDSSAVTLAGGTLNTAGFADQVGGLSISGNLAISGLVAAATAGAAGSSDFLFSSIDLSTYSGAGGSTLNLGGGYSYGQTINIASSNYTGWSGYSSGNLNNFADKVMFGSTGMKAQISFNSTTGLTYVTAIPEPKVYVAAGILCLLVGLTEVNRRKKKALKA